MLSEKGIDENISRIERMNTSYFFIPFCFEKEQQFEELVSLVKSSDKWEIYQDEIQYLMKYITDKFDCQKPDTCHCFHFELIEKIHSFEKIPVEKQWYFTKDIEIGNEEINYRFRIKNVHLYCFSTTVCILAFQIVFEKSDPLWVAAAQYHLKKVSREKIYYYSSTNAETKLCETTFLAMAQKIVSDTVKELKVEFFYYTNAGTERANVLTYLEVEEKADYTYEMYFLKHCYHEGYLFFENKEQDEKELLCITNDILWGFSSEAAVCLVRPELGRENFIRDRFYKNFNEQYLFMYVFLLHQKYVLYHFLTCLGIGSYNTLETLEEYQRQLHEFETDFVFTQITEVPQYQMLYEKLYEIHALRKMYEDVREPLDALREIRRENREKEKRASENKVNNLLLILSLLTVFSALTDSFQFVKDFLGKFFTPDIVFGIQAIIVCVILGCAAFIVRNLKKEIKQRK